MLSEQEIKLNIILEQWLDYYSQTSQYDEVLNKLHGSWELARVLNEEKALDIIDSFIDKLDSLETNANSQT